MESTSKVFNGFSRPLVESDFSDKQIILKTRSSYFQYRDLYLISENKLFKKKYRTKLTNMEDLDCKGYAFDSVDENGFYRLGIWISKDISDISQLVSLIAHEAYHIIDLVLDDADEFHHKALEFPAYMMQDIMYNAMKMIKSK